MMTYGSLAFGARFVSRVSRRLRPTDDHNSQQKPIQINEFSLQSPIAQRFSSSQRAPKLEIKTQVFKLKVTESAVTGNHSEHRLGSDTALA